jgi:hypothetical protein
LGVHALVDQPHGLNHVLAFLGEQDGPVGGADGEAAGVLAERLGRHGHDGCGGIGVHRGEDAELVPTEAVGAAAVVGVIANLALYFAVHTLFATTQPWRWGPLRLELPEPASLRPTALAITVVAVVLVFRLRWSVPRTLLVCAGLGLAAALIGFPVS